MIHHGDLFDVLPTLEPNSIDACITDPPYGIGFMGKEWDTFKSQPIEQRAKRRERKGTTRKSERWPSKNGRHGAPGGVHLDYDYGLQGLRGFQAWTEKWTREVFRILKPGAYLLVCGAPRSFHRASCGIEDAGLEIRDCLCWLFGQRFPKSLDVSKAIDRELGKPREVAAWEGWGTALKPAWEPIIVARKPFAGTVARNVLTHGTGGINIDACRLEPGEGGEREGEASADERYTERGGTDFAMKPGPRGGSELGRWPANVLLDEEAAALLDEQTGLLVSGDNCTRTRDGYFGAGEDRHGGLGRAGDVQTTYGDRGGASRFYYVAKPSRAERNFGVRDPRGNIHPTVKPVELMRYLVRLVTPPGGTVVDPFTGSGTTGMACAYELVSFIGTEREADYAEIAQDRIAACAPLFSAEARA